MKNQNAFQKFAAVPHSVWVVMFIAAPLLFVIGFAFRGADGSFSLSNITELAQYGNVFVLSIAFALIATVVCLLIGYPLAYFMSKQSARAQRILMVMVMLPMWCNLLIRTYALMALLDNGGLLNSMLETSDFVAENTLIGLYIEPEAIHVMKKSEYSGMFGDYSTFSDEIDHLGDIEEEDEE